MAGKQGQAARVEFSQAVFDAICMRIAKGESLRKICSKAGMPDRATFNGWRKLTTELQAQYDRACRDREDTYFEEIIDIADTETDPARARNRIDARKWTLACMNRKKYGTKVGVDGGDDGDPIRLLLTQVEGSGLKPKEDA